jgi:hypothetical protein
MYGRFEYCVRCGRKLRDEASQVQGMGPECASLPGSKALLDMIAAIREPALIGGDDGRTETIS